MRKTIKFLIMGVILMCAGLNIHAQSNATAKVSATIVTPIAITKIIDMDFGNVAITDIGGTVVLSPNGSRTIGGGTTLPNINGTVSAASFDVSGAPNYTYSITLQNNNVLLKHTSTPSNQMTVNTFITNPSLTGTLGLTGHQILYVGGTLNVDPNQLAGLYTNDNSTPFRVTVNYN